MKILTNPKIYIIGLCALVCIYLLCNHSADVDIDININTNDAGASFMQALANGGESAFKAIEQTAQNSDSMIPPNINNITKPFRVWIDFLSGCIINPNKLSPDEQFPYNNVQAFRDDNNTNLESYHNYIQAIFPNYAISKAANATLYLKNTDLTTDGSTPDDVLKYLLNKSKLLRHKIRLNMMLNASRMFRFWGLEYTTDYNGNPILRTGRWSRAGTKLSANDHNNLRVTRVLYSLEIFGLWKMKKVLFNALKNNYGRLDGSKSMPFWGKVANINQYANSKRNQINSFQNTQSSTADSSVKNKKKTSKAKSKGNKNSNRKNKKKTKKQESSRAGGSHKNAKKNKKNLKKRQNKKNKPKAKKYDLKNGIL
jgi:hypothetical protein